MQKKDLDFYKGKRVFITGHTGFKGSWMCRILVDAGAIVTGYALEAPTDPNLFSMAGLEGKMTSVIGDIRDYDHLKEAFEKADPEIVIHLAAQPIVRTSYKEPRLTYETNVMGTVNLLECVRDSMHVKSVINVTTDKVYHNNEWIWGYREDEPLDGYDPYSNSKSCSELATHAYVNSFFNKPESPAVSTARAGNVIGGGDFAKDRIIPDCVRALSSHTTMIIRNPHSTRPYQHVLEPVMTYLLIAEKQYEEKKYMGWYNVGPDEEDSLTTGDLVNLFQKACGEGFTWKDVSEPNAPHEANYLKLDCSKIKSVFGWRPTWHIQRAIEETVNWTRVWMEQGDIPTEMDHEIASFLEK